MDEPDSGVMEVVRAEAKESFLEDSLRGVRSGVLMGVVKWEEESVSTSRFRSNLEGISRFVDSSGGEQIVSHLGWSELRIRCQCKQFGLNVHQLPYCSNVENSQHR